MKILRQATLALALALAASGVAVAEQQVWYPVSDLVAVRVGSFEIRRSAESQAPVATAIGRTKHPDGYRFYRYGILLDDCVRGYGHVRHYGVDGGPILARFDYVQGGGTVASEVGDALCGVAAQEAAGEKREPASTSARRF